MGNLAEMGVLLETEIWPPQTREKGIRTCTRNSTTLLSNLPASTVPMGTCTRTPLVSYSFFDLLSC